MADNNEIFCKIFQKDITEEGYIYFQGRDEALEQCTFEFQEDYTKRYESIARLVINNEIVIIMEGYSYYLYFKTSPEKKFKLISVDALLLDMIRLEGSDSFIRANYQTIITFCRNLRELEKEAVFTSLMSFVLNNKKCVKDQKTKEKLHESFKIKKRLWIAVIASWVLAVAFYCADYYIFDQRYMDYPNGPTTQYKNGISNHSWAK